MEEKVAPLFGGSTTASLDFAFSENSPFWLLTVPNESGPDLERARKYPVENKSRGREVEVQEVMQKGRPLWRTADRSFRVLCFSFSKSAAGNYSLLIIAKPLDLNFLFLCFFSCMFSQIKLQL